MSRCFASHLAVPSLSCRLSSPCHLTAIWPVAGLDLQVRIDAADGTFDGYADVAALALDAQTPVARPSPTAAEYAAAAEAARLRLGAPAGTGAYLIVFMKAAH